SFQRTTRDRLRPGGVAVVSGETMSVVETIPMTADRSQRVASKRTRFDLSVVVISHGHESLMRACVSSLAKGLAGLNAQIVLLDNLAVHGFASDVDAGDSALKVITN